MAQAPTIQKRSDQHLEGSPQAAGRWWCLWPPGREFKSYLVLNLNYLIRAARTCPRLCFCLHINHSPGLPHLCLTTTIDIPVEAIETAHPCVLCGCGSSPG